MNNCKKSVIFDLLQEAAIKYFLRNSSIRVCDLQ